MNMNTLLLFFIELALCLGISLVLISLFKPLLKDILVETCGTDKRAAFWVMFTQFMLIISPLLIVVYFSPIQPYSQLNLAYELQQALFRTLLGEFIALSIVGKVIWSSIRSSNNQALPIFEEGTK
jgi:hypothetical protein